MLESCRVVEQAAVAFAAENTWPYYPTDVDGDTSQAGHTLVDLLPDGQMLLNPITHQRTVPVNGRAAHPGEIGYESYRMYSGGNAGYTITGYGLDSVVVELTNLDALEDSVRKNCLIVQQAVEQFARGNGGIYPGDLSDTDPCGNTIIDLLPRGCNLTNPFSLYATEPVGSAAHRCGETGYEVVCPGGSNVGYRITGTGRAGDLLVDITNISSSEEATVVAYCQDLRHAATRFASRNNGIYPENIYSDTTLDGETVADLFWNRDRHFRNPYTDEYDQPICRRAYYRGEVGYEVVRDGGINVGCIVTGVGDIENVLVYELEAPFHCGYYQESNN